MISISLVNSWLHVYVASIAQFNGEQGDCPFILSISNLQFMLIHILFQFTVEKQRPDVKSMILVVSSRMTMI